jgi:hypothetical protein
LAIAQVAPVGFLVQMLPMQVNPVAQSAVVAQLVRHVVVPHT